MEDKTTVKENHNTKLQILAKEKINSLTVELDDLFKELATLPKNSPSAITLNFACDHLIISIQLLKEVI